MSDDEEYDFDDFHEADDEVFAPTTIAGQTERTVDNNATGQATKSVDDLLSYFDNDNDGDLTGTQKPLNENVLPSSVDVLSVSPKSAALEYKHQKSNEQFELVNDYLAKPKDLRISLNSILPETHVPKHNTNVSNGGLQVGVVEEEEPHARYPIRIQPAVESISPRNANKPASLTTNEKAFDTGNTSEGRNSEVHTSAEEAATPPAVFDPSKLSSLKQKSLSRRKQALLEGVSTVDNQDSAAPTSATITTTSAAVEAVEAPSSSHHEEQTFISPKRKQQIGLINSKLLERRTNEQAAHHSTGSSNSTGSGGPAGLRQSIQNEFAQLGLDALSPVQQPSRSQPRPPMQQQQPGVKRNAFGKIMPTAATAVRKSTVAEDKENEKDSALTDANTAKIAFSDIGTGRLADHNNGHNSAASEAQPRKHRVSLKPAIPSRRTRPAVSSQPHSTAAADNQQPHSTAEDNQHSAASGGSAGDCDGPSSAQQQGDQPHTGFAPQKQLGHRAVPGPPRRSFVPAKSISSSDSGTGHIHNTGPALQPRPPVSLKPSVPKQVHPRHTTAAQSTLYEEEAVEAASGRYTAGSEVANSITATADDVVGSRPISHSNQAGFDTPRREEDDYFPDGPAPPLSAPLRSPLQPDRQPQTSRSQPDHQASAAQTRRLQKTSKANPRAEYSSPYRANPVAHKKTKPGKASGVVAVAQGKTSKKYHKGRDWMADPTHRYDAATGLFSSFETDAKREFRKEQVRVNAMLRRAAVEKESELARVALMQRQHEIEVVERLHEQCSLVAALQEERAAAVLVQQRLAELRAAQELEEARTQAQLMAELTALRKQQQLQSLPPPSAPSTTSPGSPPRRRLHFAAGPEPDHSPQSGSKSVQSSGTEDRSPAAAAGPKKLRPDSGASAASTHSYPRKGRQFVARSTAHTKKSPTAKTTATAAVSIREVGNTGIEKSPPKPAASSAVKVDAAMLRKPEPPFADFPPAAVSPASADSNHSAAPTSTHYSPEKAAQSHLGAATAEVVPTCAIPVRAPMFVHPAVLQDAQVAAVVTAESNLHAEEQKISSKAQAVDTAHPPADDGAGGAVAGGSAGFAKSKGRISLEQLAALSAAASTLKFDLFGDEVDVQSVQHEIGLGIEDSAEEASPLEDSTYYLGQVKSMVGLDASDAQNIAINAFYSDSPFKQPQQHQAVVGMSLEDAFTFAGELDLPLEGAEEVGNEEVCSAEEEEEYGEQDWEDEEVESEEVEEDREVPPLEEEIVQQSPQGKQALAVNKEVRIVPSLHSTGDATQASDARSSSSNKVRRSSTPGNARRMQLVSPPASAAQMEEAFSTTAHRRSTPKVRKTPVSSRRNTAVEEGTERALSREQKPDSAQSNLSEYADEPFEADEYDDDFETTADVAEEDEQRVRGKEVQSGSALEESPEPALQPEAQPNALDSGRASSREEPTEREWDDWGVSTTCYERDEGSVQDSPLQGLRLGGSVDLDLQDSLTFSAAGDTLSYSPDRTGAGDFSFHLEETTELSFYVSQPSLFEEELEPAQRLSDYPLPSQELPAGTEEDLYGDDCDFEEDVEELSTAAQDAHTVHHHTAVSAVDLVSAPAVDVDVYSGIIGIADVPNSSSGAESTTKVSQQAVDLTDSLGEDEFYSFAGAGKDGQHSGSLSHTWAPAAIASAAQEYDDEFETGEEDDDDGLLFFNNGQKQDQHSASTQGGAEMKTATIDVNKSKINLIDKRDFGFEATPPQQHQGKIAEQRRAEDSDEDEYSFTYKPSASITLSVSADSKGAGSGSADPSLAASSAVIAEKTTASSPYSVRNFSMVVADSAARQQQPSQQSTAGSTGGSYGDRKAEILRRIQQQQLTEDSDEASDQKTGPWQGVHNQSEKSAEPELSYLPTMARPHQQQQKESSLPALTSAPSLSVPSRGNADWRRDEAEVEAARDVQQPGTAPPITASAAITATVAPVTVQTPEEYEDDGFDDEDMDEVDISESGSVESSRHSPSKRAKKSKKDKKARKKAKKASKRGMEQLLGGEGSSGEDSAEEEEEWGAGEGAAAQGAAISVAAGPNSLSEAQPPSQWGHSGAAKKEEQTTAAADEYEDEFEYDFGTNQRPPGREDPMPQLNFVAAGGGKEEEYANDWADSSAFSPTDSARHSKKAHKHKHKKEKKAKRSKGGKGAEEELIIEEDEEDGWERGSSRGSSTDGTQSSFSTYNASPTRENSTYDASEYSTYNEEEAEFPEDGSMFSRSPSKLNGKSAKKSKKEKKGKSKHKHRHKHRHSAAPGGLQDLEEGDSSGSSAEEEDEFDYE